MKTLIMGNSHIAALISGAATVEAERPGWSFDFFGAPGANADWFRLDDDLKMTVALPDSMEPKAARRKRNRIRKINGGEAADLRRYDLVLKVGAQFGALRVKQIIAFYDVDGFPGRASPGLMSEAAFRAACHALAARFLPGEDWRRETPFALYEAPPPLEAESVHDASVGASARGAHQSRLVGAGPLYEVFLEEADKAYSDFGIRLLRQPAHTVTPALNTYERYAKGAKRLVADVEHDDADFSHMNAEYGKEVLKALIARVEADASVAARSRAGAPPQTGRGD